MSSVKNRGYVPDDEQEAFSNLLSDIAKAVRKLPEDQFRKLVDGKLRPKISFEERHRPASVGRVNPAKPSIRIVPEDDLRGIRARLDRARSREEGRRIVLDALPERKRLFAFARFLDLPIRKGDKAENVREKIVTFTVGRRLSGEAVRGGYTAM